MKHFLKALKLKLERFRLLRYVQRHEVIPAWYGVAWEDWLTSGTYVAPIPLALLVAVARWLWRGLLVASRAMACDPRVAYLDGVEHGLRLARERPPSGQAYHIVNAGGLSRPMIPRSENE